MAQEFTKVENLVPSAARTATGTGTAVKGFGPATKLRAALVVSAASGTTPTLDVVIEDTIDGTTYFTLIAFTQRVGVANEAKNFTELEAAAGQVFTDQLRARWTIGGTGPSFTFAVDVFAQ